SPAQSEALRRGGFAPEAIRVIPFASSPELFVESAILEIEHRLWPQPMPIARPDQVRVELEGELFAGHSFSNVNANLLTELGNIDSLALSFRRVYVNTTNDRRAAYSTDLRKFINRDLGGPPDVTIRHSYPPNWSAPSSGHWIHIQPWEF